MNCCPTLRRWLSVAFTVLILGIALVAVVYSGRANRTDDAKSAATAYQPMFGGGLHRNMVNLSEKGIQTTCDIQSGKNIKWTAKLGSKAYGGPIIASGKVFVGTNNDAPRDPKIKGDKGILMCFDEATGKFLWQVVHNKLSSGLVNDWPREGICSSPYVEGNRLWYVSNRCEVVCRDTDGKELWSLDMIGKLDVFPHNLAVCSPLVVGDTLFVITSNGVDEGHINIPKPGAPSFLALDKNNGKVLWTSNLPSANLKPGAELKKLVDRGQVLMHGQWSNPVYAEVDAKGQIIFPGGDGWIRAFDPKDGTVIWQFDGNPKDAIYALGGKGTRSDFLGTPVVADNKLYAGIGQDPEHDLGVGHFWCIDIAKATKTGGDVSPELPVIDAQGKQTGKPNPNSAAVWQFGGMITPPPKMGRKWHFGRTISTAAVVDGLCYIGELEGFLHCLDAKTGKELWQHDMGKPMWSSAYFVDGKIYAASDDGHLLVFKHGPTEEIIADNDMDGMIRATPVAVNGVLYVMTENKLYAIK
jgi:outer membrane protein assembly factor BamB